MGLPQNLWVRKRVAGSAPARQEGSPLPPSPSLRPAQMRAKRRRRREGRLEFTSKKDSLPGLDFKYDKRRPSNASHPAEKPGEG